MSGKVIQNSLILKMLDRAVAHEHLHHALLFYGPESVGKFTTAIALTQQLNCVEKQPGGCGECLYCRRVKLPFPFHPDVKILRNIDTPMVIRHDDILRKYIRENKISKDMETIREKYTTMLKSLKDEGLFKRLISCQEASADVIVCNKDKLKSLSEGRTDDTSRLQRWFLKKLAVFVSGSTYQNTIKIEQVRDIKKILSYHAFEAGKKVVIIDEAENMKTPAQNCLLKMLEEPPGQSYLILITSNPSALLPTIRSRCQMVPFRKLSNDMMVQVLTKKFGYSGKSAKEKTEFCEGSVLNVLLDKRTSFLCREHVFSGIFTNLKKELLADWAIRSTNILIQETENSIMDNEYEVVNDLYRWLHQQMNNQISEQSEKTNLMLPGGRNLDIDDLFNMMDQLTQLMNIKQFNVDLRLQLESIFLSIGNKQ